jgi:membrane protease YdiL (CAAX protease family)
MRPHQRQLLSRGVLVEGGFLGIALVWSFFGKIPLQDLLAPVFPHVWIGMGLGCGILGLSVVTLTYGPRYLGCCRRIKHLMEHEVAPLFRGFSIGSAGLLAIVSGVSEEVLFRGILQTQFGLVAASILFGVVHIWRKDAVSYGIYAAIIGVLLGGVYAVTQNLWGPIVAHTLNNFVAILYCARISQDVRYNSVYSEEVTYE